MNEIYWDNSATTKVCAPAIAKMVDVMENRYGNPSSLHAKGFEAEQVLKQARTAVAAPIGADASEIIFTSGGTEANNLALFGAVGTGRRKSGRIVTTAIEHPSVLRVMEQLEKQGFEVIYLMPDHGGNLPLPAMEKAIHAETILVSMMAVNNETGVILPLEAAVAAIRRVKAPALFHVDAVQAYGKLPLQPRKLGIDLMSLSAHKIYGPKGVGALYRRQSVHLRPVLYGGGQEKGLRSGTEALPAIAGFGAAVAAMPPQGQAMEQMQKLNQYCRKQLVKIEGVILQSPPDASPYILNFSIPGLRSETLLHYLSNLGVYVSSGSACSGNGKSHVLQAMQLPVAQVDASLRLSFSGETTLAEVDFFAQAIQTASVTLIKKTYR